MHSSRRHFLSAAALLGVSGSVWPKTKASAPRPSATAPWCLHRSESFTLSWGGRQFLIGIALPREVDPEVPLMVSGYKPVPIYVTDGADNFPTVAALTRQMQWGGEVPPCLVIGIDYVDVDSAQELRSRELTPTTRPNGRSEESKERWGGADNFRRFLVDTLRPMIEQRFDVDRSRATLVGHSFGGLFALDAMVKEPDAFDNYLALSPSLWFDGDLVLRAFKQKLVSGTVFNSRVAVLAGEQEERISEPEAHMTSNTLEFGRLVAGHRAGFPNGAWVSILPRTTHHTIIGPGVTQGLRYLIAPEDRRSESF